MIKVTYMGKVPAGYMDSGIAKQVFYIDDSKFDIAVDNELIKTLAEHDCRQCLDCTFLRLQSIEKNSQSKIGFMTTIYTGIKPVWDNYFKEYFTKYTTNTDIKD